jgi:curved DNA-binding protein CbpA
MYVSPLSTVEPVGRDYYERLGVPRDASTAEIERAYRERIKETHPDVSDDDSAHERTKRLIEARDVLTDETERRRYDRLGHEAYLGRDGSASDSAAERPPGSDAPTNDSAGGEATRTNRSGRARRDRAGNGGRTGPRGQEATAEGRYGRDGGRASGSTRSRTADGGHAGTADWYHTSTRDDARTREGTHRAWGPDRAYAVGNDQGMFDPSTLLSSQRTVGLLGTTFVIYPVLLFGALFPAFPTAVNLVVAMCLVLVIAFLQSVPQVGMAVFAVWTVLLPLGLFGGLGVAPLSLVGVLATAAVVFPLGLSVLSWFAIRPMGR